MKLSEKAWEISSKIIESIKKHPFNIELMHGVLKLDKFAYYIEQDSLYLKDFARCLAIIAAKAPLKYFRTFLRYSEETFIAEQDIVHSFFKEKFNFVETGKITPATLSYTSYLLRTCCLEQPEVAIAAILPCFWVYREVGLDIAAHQEQNNPFARWIETYSSEDFNSSVNEAIGIFDEVATNTTDEIRSKMLESFYNSTCLEWHFWNDAYKRSIFHNIE